MSYQSIFGGLLLLLWWWNVDITVLRFLLVSFLALCLWRRHDVAVFLKAVLNELRTTNVFLPSEPLHISRGDASILKQSPLNLTDINTATCLLSDNFSDARMLVETVLVVEHHKLLNEFMRSLTSLVKPASTDASPISSSKRCKLLVQILFSVTRSYSHSLFWVPNTGVLSALMRCGPLFYQATGIPIRDYLLQNSLVQDVLIKNTGTLPYSQSLNLDTFIDCVFMESDEGPADAEDWNTMHLSGRDLEHALELGSRSCGGSTFVLPAFWHIEETQANYYEVLQCLMGLSERQRLAFLDCLKNDTRVFSSWSTHSRARLVSFALVGVNPDFDIGKVGLGFSQLLEWIFSKAPRQLPLPCGCDDEEVEGNQENASQVSWGDDSTSSGPAVQSSALSVEETEMKQCDHPPRDSTASMTTTLYMASPGSDAYHGILEKEFRTWESLDIAGVQRDSLVGPWMKETTQNGKPNRMAWVHAVLKQEIEAILANDEDMIHHSWHWKQLWGHIMSIFGNSRDFGWKDDTSLDIRALDAMVNVFFRMMKRYHCLQDHHLAVLLACHPHAHLLRTETWTLLQTQLLTSPLFRCILDEDEEPDAMSFLRFHWECSLPSSMPSQYQYLLLLRMLAITGFSMYECYTETGYVFSFDYSTTPITIDLAQKWIFLRSNPLLSRVICLLQKSLDCFKQVSEDDIDTPRDS